MSMRVFDWDSNPELDLYVRQSDNRANDLVRAGTHRYITLASGLKAVQKLPPTAAQLFFKPAAIKNLVPFGRVYDKLKFPPHLHYPIPAVGAHGRLLLCRNVNQPQALEA
jgi:hypothetical protein